MNIHSAMAREAEVRSERAAVPVPGRRVIAAGGKREAIVAAALELFAERTFDGTPMPRVAERAGVGAGTIYRYFASKEALGNAVFRECKAAMRRLLVDGIPPGLPPREHFRAIFRGLGAFASRHPAAFRFLELQHHDDYLDAESRALSAELFAGIADFVRGAQHAGAVRTGDPRVLIALAFGAFVGLAKEAQQGRFALDAASLDTAEAAVWAMLGRREEEGGSP
jgi:TetR/AcrR family transcriptional regulator, repressor of fatR-cypB operon